MDSTSDIQWLGDSKERFLERVAGIEVYGIYEGKVDLGRRYAAEVLEKTELAAQNLNQYPARLDGERVIPFSHGVIVYKVIKIVEPGKQDFQMQIVDVRAAY